MVKYDINRLYEAKLTIRKQLEYAPGASFISKSEEKFIFVKDNDKFIEVFTEEEFHQTVKNVSLAKTTGILITPKKLPQNSFKKYQRKQGKVSQLEIVPVYTRINTETKKLIKARAA